MEEIRYLKYNVHYTFNKDFRKESGPFFFISNHASRLDYIFVGGPLLPLKKNFTPDIYTVKGISRVIKSRHGVCIFPEGMSSISGANQPVALGTGKLFKHHKVPVYYSVIRGGYLTSPKYNLRDRAGYVEVEYDQLSTVEDLEQLTPAEIESRINRVIYHDDYAWNKVHKHHYDIGENGAEDLENLLFWCPRCKKQHTMATKGNTIFCTECGNSAALPTYGMCTDLSRFYTFVNGEFVKLYPENKVVEKFFLATEELHRLNGGKWKDFDFK